jgi:hypothetical protein
MAGTDSIASRTAAIILPIVDHNMLIYPRVSVIIAANNSVANSVMESCWNERTKNER